MAISTTFANLPDGLQSLALFDQAFAEVQNGSLSEPYIVTGSSYVIPAATQAVIAIHRTAPALTTLYFPDVLLQKQIPIRVFDWSDSVTDHEIRCLPYSAQTIGKAGTWSLYSNASQLAGATFNPSANLPGWYISP